MKIIDVSPTLALGKSLGGVPVPTPFQLRHKIRISQVRVWVAVALEAPTHTERLDLPDTVHRVYAAVTLHAAHAPRDMRGVVEIGVVGKIMYADPLHRATSAVTLPEWLEQLTLWVNLCVAIHARLRRWDCCLRCDLDCVVAITTVHPELPCVYRVAKWNWLHRLIANVSRLRAEPERD